MRQLLQIWMFALALITAAWSAPDDLQPLRQAMALGRHQQAVTLGLSLLKTDLDHSGQVEVLVIMANAKQALGFYQDAENLLNRAREKAGSAPADEALVLASMGDILLSSHRMEEAMVVLEQGIAKARSVDHHPLLARLLNNLGNVHAARNAYEKAATSYAEAMELPGTSEDRGLWATLAVNQARVAWRGGQPDAMTRLDAAHQALTATPEGYGRIMGLLTLSQIWFQMHRSGMAPAARLTQAVEEANEAARLAEKIADARSLSQALGQQGEIYAFGDRQADATRLTRQALFHALRVNAADLAYLWQSQLGRLAREAGRKDEAMRLFREALATLSELRKEMYRGPRDNPELFRERVAPVYYQLADLLLQQSSATPEGETRTALLKEARQIVEQLKTSELQNLFQDECVTAMRHRGAEVDQVGAHHAIYYPILLPDRLELLLTLPGGLRQITVEVPATQVEETARAFRNQLEKSAGDGYLLPAQRLYKWLIAPVEALLRAEAVTTMIVIPDGLLRIIPFAALHDGRQFLAETMAVAITPSLRLTDARQLPRQSINIFINALSEGVQGFPPLPNVVTEVERIRHLFPHSRLLMDQEYTLAKTEQIFQEQPFTILHIASHGQFDQDPRNTFLLSFDGRMTMNHLAEMIGRGRFRDHPVELLTLSACQTAVGDDRSALGLAGVAVKAGARSALASLWSIDDEATALLVSDVYAHLQDVSLSKAEALRRSQVKLIKNERLRHPGFWSAFILIGNWL